MQYRTKNRELQRKINKKKKALQRAEKLEASSRKKWTLEYGKFMKATKDLATIKVHGTAKEKGLREKILSWPKRSVELTKIRDQFRVQVTAIREDLTTLGLEQALLNEQQNSEIGLVDEIVKQVFDLNEATVRAATSREECLTRHVFPRLISEDGKLASQVSFTSTNGLRRVVAMVNTMTLIQGDLATKAKAEIERFFDRFQATAMNTITQALYKLTKEILVEKTKFKVGPNLYRFLGMELDSELFPELTLAQQLLRQSIRSEKTNSYIRIYERKSLKDKWEVVKQS